jgi:tetratricopeptide (TPR) repeat protein
MKFFYFLIILILSINLFSETIIDSLESQLKITDNKEKVYILNELAKAYWRISPLKSVKYGGKSAELAIKLGDIKGEALAYNSIGVGYNYLGDYKKALEFHIKALKMRKKIGDKKYIASSLTNLGLVYEKLSNYSKALEYYLKSLKLNEEIGDKTGIATSSVNIGNIYEELKNYNNALEYYQNSLKLFKETNNKMGISVCINNIGLIYSAMGNYQESLKFYLESLKISEKMESLMDISNSLMNIGTTYFLLKNYEKALDFFLRALKLSQDNENKYDIALILNNIGANYTLLGNYDNAYTYLNKSFKVSKDIGARDLEKENYQYFSELYLEKKDYKKALEYYKLYIGVKDSIFTDESSEKIAEMQTKYETEKKEKENEILKKDNDIQKLEINKQQNLRNSFIIISILILILAFVIYTRYRSKQKTNIILSQKNIQIENANTKLNQKNKQITKQKNQLSKTLKELSETQKMLTDTAHRAGMAEIATGILHNVGNVLNSVKVSSQILKEKIKSSKVNNLQKVLSLMEEHTNDIGEFITSDEKGKMLPTYLLKVGTTLKDEQDNSLEELSSLHNGINHIEEIIAVQQSYAGVSGLVEKVALSNMMDDVLKMHSEMFRKYKIKITKKYSKTKPILIEKGKLIQVFVNLLKNAKESLETKNEKNRIITINISEDKQYQTVEITDNGTGIPKKNLTKIFSYGFSTKKEGKGFGLHTSALAMTEIKGKLILKSDGIGKGAKFIVKVPVE